MMQNLCQYSNRGSLKEKTDSVYSGGIKEEAIHER